MASSRRKLPDSKAAAHPKTRGVRNTPDQASQKATTDTELSRPRSIVRSVGRVITGPYHRLKHLRARRAHKSFVRSRRRDYVRKLALPGLFRLTLDTLITLRQNWRLFALLSLAFTALALVLGGLSSQQLYGAVVDSVSNDIADASQFIQTATLVVSSANLFTTGLSETQQIYIGFMTLMAWLVSVWLLRDIMAGNQPRLRDGLYNAGAPLIATIIVTLLLLVQLVPLGIVALVYGALSTTGLISQGLGAFLFFGTSALVAVLTLYWVTSTLLALVIVTLPGMYPWRAMKSASDIIVGRRLTVLYRIVWMLVTALLIWAAVMTPVILVDNWLRGVWDWFAQVPLVPVSVVWLTSAVAIWCATYVYILYRKVVSGDTESNN